MFLIALLACAPISETGDPEIVENDTGAPCFDCYAWRVDQGEPVPEADPYSTSIGHLCFELGAGAVSWWDLDSGEEGTWSASGWDAEPVSVPSPGWGQWIVYPGSYDPFTATPCPDL